jgi:hypothetical protein
LGFPAVFAATVLITIQPAFKSTSDIVTTPKPSPRQRNGCGPGTRTRTTNHENRRVFLCTARPNLVYKLGINLHRWEYLPGNKRGFAAKCRDIGNTNESPFGLRPAINQDRIARFLDDAPGLLRRNISRVAISWRNTFLNPGYGTFPQHLRTPHFFISGTTKKAVGYFYKYALGHTPETLRNKHRLKNIIKNLL